MLLNIKHGYWFADALFFHRLLLQWIRMTEKWITSSRLTFEQEFDSITQREFPFFAVFPRSFSDVSSSPKRNHATNNQLNSHSKRSKEVEKEKESHRFTIIRQSTSTIDNRHRDNRIEIQLCLFAFLLQIHCCMHISCNQFCLRWQVGFIGKHFVDVNSTIVEMKWTSCPPVWDWGKSRKNLKRIAANRIDKALISNGTNSTADSPHRLANRPVSFDRNANRCNRFRGGVPLQELPEFAVTSQVHAFECIMRSECNRPICQWSNVPFVIKYHPLLIEN